MAFSLTSLAVVAATGLAAPLLLEILPGVALPNVVAEIGLGILVGPSVLGWAHADEPVQVLALIGLSFLLLIAGLEVDYARFRGRLLRLCGAGFVVSLALGLVAGVGLREAGLVRSPLLLAIMLSATGLGIVIAVLKDAERVETPLGQLVIAERFGLEAILGAFLAGAILKVVDRDEAMTHSQFRAKLEAVGFGVFIPFFFVTSGGRYDAGALFSSGSTLCRGPL